jgi:hypothetical protein
LRAEADRIRRLLDSTSVYLVSVLDREIERESSGQLNAGELVLAAASYAELEKPELDRRLLRATEILCRAIAIDGSFAASTSLDTNSRGYSAIIIGSELLRAFAQLLQRIRFDVPTDTIKRMLSYFERTAVQLPDGSIVGWSGDQPRFPIKASRWTSALAVLALDRITRMLDDRINRRIFRHFTVKRTSYLRSKPRLEQLFYPDYGLATQSDSDASDDRYKGSVAYLLERMRGHIIGLPNPPGFDERCYSLLLFGPPGTGKTQLVESLATSSDAYLVEITPSDFLLEGDALVERQARNVFKCLSCLTNTVVLFDEFDPMIRSRGRKKDVAKLDAFAFLTPGMLPKLKLLNDRAKERQVAFCLITNRVGSLDEAAIRTGRFDFKVGIYPPDLLSRVGRLIFVVDQICERNDKLRLPPDYLTRLTKVLAATAGRGMTLLGRPGNFTVPKSDLPRQASRSVLKYLLQADGGNYLPGKPDATLREEDRPSPERVLELEQWLWVQAWDNAYASAEKKTAKDGIRADDRWENPYKLIDSGRPSADEVREKVPQYLESEEHSRA